MAAEKAATTDSSTVNSGDGKPQHRTPWNQVVKGTVESSPENHESESSVVCDVFDCDNGGNVGKKQAWVRPANVGAAVSISVVVDGAASGVADGDHGGGGGVMGAAAWPALGESTRLSQKSSSPSSPGLPNVTPEVSVSGSQVSGTSYSHQPKRDIIDSNHTSSSSTPTVVRQRSIKRGGGTGGNRQGGGVVRGPPLPPPLPMFVTPPESSRNSFGRGVPIGQEPTSRSVRASLPFGSQSSMFSEHANKRNSNRRGGNSGQNSRNSYHGRRDYDQGSSDWNSPQISPVLSIHGRARPFGPPLSMQGHVSFVPPSLRPPADFLPTMRPYSDSAAYGDMLQYVVYPIPSAELYPGTVPYFGTTPHLPFFMDPLCQMLLNQVQYYFSDENLKKDVYLRKKMDSEGWVPIALIAGFPRVKELNVNIPYIIDSLKASIFLEIKDDRVRRRGDGKKWVIRDQSSSDLGVQSAVDSHNLTTSLQKVSLEEGSLDDSTES